MTAVLDEILRLLGLATPPALTAEARNLLRFPAADPPAVRHGALVHREGGLVSDAALRPRVSVLLGPGATFQGVADRLAPLYDAAAAGGGPAAPSREELARAVVVYNQTHLPAGTWTEHRVGLRLPLPVEVDATDGGWILDADAVRAWAELFAPGWLPRLTHPPAALEFADPLDRLPQQAADIRAAQPTVPGLAAELQARMLRNPFAEVVLVLEVLRQLGADAAAVAVSVLDATVEHQARLLAATSAGHVLLRRFAALLAAAPAGTDPAALARARDLLERVLFEGPAGSRRRVGFQELPETPGQLAARGPVQAATTTDPQGGLHRLVLGRDVAVGKVATETIVGVAYRGPAYAGRLDPAAFVAADAARLNPGGDPALAARLAIVVAIAANEGQLDAVRQRDRGIISSGIHQWSAHKPDELPSLLSRFKDLAPDEFDVFFGVHGLDVDADPGAPGHFRLIDVAPDGTRTVMDLAAARTFFGGSVGADGVVSFTTTWAARMRAAALASEAFRRCQILEAVGRFDRIRREVGSVTVAAAPVPLADLISSRQGVALILDAHINLPDDLPGGLRTAAQGTGIPADADGRDRTITARFHDQRSVYDRAARNARVDARQLDPAHGSFAGW